MAKYENSCFLSKAKEKRGNGPDYYGQIELTPELVSYAATGGPVRVALWRKENERGVYLSMQLSEPAAQVAQARGGGGRQQMQANTQRRADDDDDVIPF